MAAVQARLDPDNVLRDVPADRPRYDDRWDSTYKSRFRGVLNELGEDAIEIICELLDIDPDSGDVKAEIFEHESEAVTLFTLHQFISDKRTLLREMAGRKGVDVDNGREYRYLLQAILDGNPEIIYQLLLYDEWSEAKNRRTYEIENRLPDDYISRFNENFRSIQVTLARRTRIGNFHYNERNEIGFENSTIFAIDRQTSDREQRDVIGAQRRRNLRSVYIEVDGQDETVQITTNNQTIRETRPCLDA